MQLHGTDKGYIKQTQVWDINLLKITPINLGVILSKLIMIYS